MAKLRNCLVSNSSSSSFIVATKSHKVKFNISITVDLSKYTDKTFDTVTEMVDYFIREWDYTLESPEVKKAALAIMSGKSVLIGSFSNESDDPISCLLCEIGLNKCKLPSDIEVIYGEGGY